MSACADVSVMSCCYLSGTSCKSDWCTARSWVNARPNDGLTTLECRLFADFFRCSVLSYDFSRRLEWNNMPSWAGVRKCSEKKNMPTTVQHGNGTQTPCSVPKLHAVASDNVTRPKKKSFLADGDCYKVATEIIGQPENWKGILLKPGKHLILVKLRSTSRTALEVSQIFLSFAMILPWFVPIFCHGNLPCSMLQTAACWLATMEASCSATFEDHKWSSNLLGWPRRFTNELILVVCM